MHRHTEDSGRLVFVKIHAPLPVLKRYAAMLKLRLPMRREFFSEDDLAEEERGGGHKDGAANLRGLFSARRWKSVIFRLFNHGLDRRKSGGLTAVYSSDREFL